MEKILEFTELYGPYSGENLAAVVRAMLLELNLEDKLLIISNNNVINNEDMALQLSYNLQ